MGLTINDVSSYFSRVKGNYLSLKEQAAPIYFRSELFNTNDAPAIKSIYDFEELLTKFESDYVSNAKNECRHNEFEHTSIDLDKLSTDISSVLEDYEKIKEALSDSSRKAFDEMKSKYDSIVNKINSNIEDYTKYSSEYETLRREAITLINSGALINSDEDATGMVNKINSKLSDMNECCDIISNSNTELEELIKTGFKRQNQMYGESASDYSINVKNAKNKNFSEISMI